MMTFSDVCMGLSFALFLMFWIDTAVSSLYNNNPLEPRDWIHLAALFFLVLSVSMN